MDLASQVTSGPGALAGGIKRYWLFAVLGVLVALALFVRYRNTLASKLSGLPASFKTWLKITGLALPISWVLLHGSNAFAGVASCCAKVATSGGSHTAILAGIISAISLASGSLAFGHVFGAEDTLDLEDSAGGRTITFTPATGLTEKSLFLNVHKAMDYRGRPLVATGITIAITTTVTQPHTGAAAITDQDLARVADSVNIESPLLGTLLDKSTGKGPVLDLLISFLGLGFNNSGNAPCPTIPATADLAQKVTKYFTFPIATKYLSDPAATAMYLKALDKTEIKVTVAGTACLNSVSTGAVIGGTDSTLRATVSYLPHSHFFRPQIAYYRLDQPSSGSDGLTFNSFGDAGPKCTVPVDAIASISQVSNLKGLPGNTAISNITRILGAQLGLDDVANLDLFVQARIRAQIEALSGINVYANGGNWAQGTTDASGGMALAGLLALHLVQPASGSNPKNFMVANSESLIKIREEVTTPLTTQHAFLISSIRQVADNYVQKISALYDGKVPLTNPVHSARR